MFLDSLMCKTKMAVNASNPTPSSSTRTTRHQTHSPRPRSSTRSPRTPPFTTATSSTSAALDPSTSTSSYYSTTSSSTATLSSLSSLRSSLPQNPHIYDISEIRSATNNFLSKRHSSSTPCWRCTLRNADTIVFQRKFRRRIETSELKQRLSVICRSHHMSVVNLLGASLSSSSSSSSSSAAGHGGDYIYLVYQFVPSANLSDCLRNQRNPNFTVLSTWQSRMQIASDIAHALDYIHNKTGLDVVLVHNHIKSSSIIVTEPSFNAKICHFGTAQLCGEAEDTTGNSKKKQTIEIDEIREEADEDEDDNTVKVSTPSPKLTRSDSRGMQFEGVRGYMSPEYQSTGTATQKSDVYAFGVVILELLSGEEPLKYKYDKSRGDFIRTSVIETAAAAIGGEDGRSGREGRLRRWVDGKLKDSFPVDVAVKLTRIALECVHVDPDKRPDMGRVAGKISKLYLESQIWSDRLRVPNQISVSLGPR